MVILQAANHPLQCPHEVFRIGVIERILQRSRQYGIPVNIYHIEVRIEMLQRVPCNDNVRMPERLIAGGELGHIDRLKLGLKPAERWGISRKAIQMIVAAGSNNA
jgi:hypothetical protein